MLLRQALMRFRMIARVCSWKEDLTACAFSVIGRDRVCFVPSLHDHIPKLNIPFRLYSRVGERPKRRRSATSILPNELDLTATGPTQTTSENQGHVAISADRDQDEPMVSVTPVEESKSEEGKDIDQEFGSKNPFATATAVPTMTGDENTTKHTIESSLSEDIEPRPASSDAINAPAPAPTSPHTAITTSPKQATVIQSAAAAPPVAVPGVERDVQTRQAALAAAAQAALSRRKDGGQVE